MKKVITEVKFDKNSLQLSLQPLTRKTEISKRAREERDFLSGMLIQQADELVELEKTRKEFRENTIIEFRNGTKTTIGEINSIIASSKQNYPSQFSNAIPFFKEYYRIMNWEHLNYNDYVKPREVALFINKVIYGRFNKEILPAIHVLNPFVGFGIRLNKHYQYLTIEGIKKLEQFRDEAIEIMEECNTLNELEIALYSKLGITFQLSLFENNY